MTEQLHFHFSLSCIGEGNGNPLQCSCLENPRDGGAWWAAIYGVTQSQTRLKWLSSSSSICRVLLCAYTRLPCSSNSKESACKAGDQGSIPGLGSSSEEGNGKPLHYSCLENSMDGEAWWATVHRVAKSRTRVSDTHTHTHCVPGTDNVSSFYTHKVTHSVNTQWH